MEEVGIEKAIKVLAETAQDNELMGSGRLPPVAARVQAVISLGTFVPHPKAVQALQEVLEQSWAPEEIRVAAVRALSRRDS